MLDIAVTTYNEHGGDPNLAKDIVEITNLFAFKSEKSKQRIKDNIESIKNIIQKEKEYEASLTIGGVDCSIEVDGVHKGKEFISSKDIESVRWGGVVSGTSSSQIYEYSFVFKSRVKVIAFQWKATRDLEKNDQWNREYILAITHYIFPFLLEKLLNRR